MSYTATLDETITDIGGCGLHQWINSLIIHGSKIVTVITTLTMAFAGQNPGFTCTSMSIFRESINRTDFSDISVAELCELDGTTQCESFQFHRSMSSVVTEWDLVCRRAWIKALITSLQMLGIVIGCPLSGRVADSMGPKPTFFIGLIIVVVFNFIGIFSTYLEVYIIIRLIIGIGIAFSITVQFALLIEYAPARLMPLITAIPSVPLASCLFALVAWWLHDWKMIHLFIAVAGFPFLLTYWFVPESFTWHMMKSKTTSAEKTINLIARVNRKTKPEITNLLTKAVSELQSSKNGNGSGFAALFSNGNLALTAGLYLQWFAAGYTYFGLIFGVNILYGNLYLNMFLINVVDAPLMALSGALVAWFGRKKYGIFAMAVSSLCGICVGILQHTQFSHDWLITVLALICKMTGASAWIVLMIYTLEIYPSDIKTLGFGFQYTGMLIGSVVAPQIILLNEHIPGLLYFISGALMCMSAICFLFFRETKDLDLKEPLLGKDMELDREAARTRRLSMAKMRSVSSMEIP